MRYRPLLSPRAGKLQRAQWAEGAIIPSWPLASVLPCRVLLMFFPFIKNSQVVRAKRGLLPVLWPNPDAAGPKGVPVFGSSALHYREKSYLEGTEPDPLVFPPLIQNHCCVTLEEVRLKEAATLLGVILEMNSSPILPKPIILWWRRNQEIENIKHFCFYIALYKRDCCCLVAHSCLTLLRPFGL